MIPDLRTLAALALSGAAVFAPFASTATAAPGSSVKPGAKPASGPASPAAQPPAAKPPAAKPEGASPATSGRIQWREWEPAAFLRAKALDRPILLAVNVSWSRLCRDMERTWSDPGIARLANEGFIPIRVDADRRPDIRDRYPTGTWPSVTLLLPNGDPMFFATKEGKGTPARMGYGLLPPERLAPILQEALAYYRTRRATLKAAVEEGLKAEAEPDPVAGQIDPDALTKMAEALRANFDALHGGWTKAPKFPMSAPIQALLFAASRDDDQASRETAERALRAIVDSPLFDRVDGGVHRLALEEDWTRPEYEKLLDRNVTLLDDLLSAFVVTSNPVYAERAGDIVRFLEGPLKRPGGGYFASQSSDPSSADGGDYYRAAAPERATRPAPPVDRLVPVGWSARAAAAELRASVLLGRRDLVRPARETLDWLVSNAYGRSRGVVHAIEGGRSLPLTFLEDQVLFAEALLTAAQITGDKRYSDTAADVARFAIGNLRSPKTGLFGDTIPMPSGPAPLQKALWPFEINCRMARVLAELYYLDARERTFRNAASGILSAYASRYLKIGPVGGAYAIAAGEYRDGPTWVWVVGEPRMPGFAALYEEANRIPALWKIVVRLDVIDDRDTIARQGFVFRNPPALYITNGSHTSKPAQFPAEIAEIYRALTKQLAEDRKNATGGAAPPPARPPGAGAGAPATGRTGKDATGPASEGVKP